MPSDYDFIVSHAATKLSDTDIARDAGVDVAIVHRWASWARDCELPFPVTRDAILRQLRAYIENGEA